MTLSAYESRLTKKARRIRQEIREANSPSHLLTNQQDPPTSYLDNTPAPPLTEAVPQRIDKQSDKQTGLKFESHLAKVARLKRDLQVDRAITLGQLERHYKLDQLAHPFLSMLRTIYPSADLDTYAHMTAYTLEKKVIKYQAGPLLHLIGTAEIRHALGAPVEQWRSSGQKMAKTLVPDAVWSTPDGDIAIEYDTGTYRYKLIHRKIETFTAQYAGIIWGTPSPERCARIKELYPWVRTLCVADLDSLAGTKDSRS